MKSLNVRLNMPGLLLNKPRIVMTTFIYRLEAWGLRRLGLYIIPTHKHETLPTYASASAE
jgi:hypothetical protein